MSLLKVCLTVAVIASIVIDQGNARPTAADVMKNTIKKTSEYKEELDGNNTKRGKESKNAHPTNNPPKNSDITKAITTEYEYDEDYDAPIIEIKFKRDTTTTEEVEDAFNKLRKSILSEKILLNRFTKWSREYHTGAGGD